MLRKASQFLGSLEHSSLVANVGRAIACITVLLLLGATLLNVPVSGAERQIAPLKEVSPNVYLLTNTCNLPPTQRRALG
jgi:hypothetical protein